jgi:cytidylate kinase
MREPIVAIDGPAGAGKSTVARLVAERLGYLYIDTGAMYRAVAWKVLEEGMSVSDHRAITALANRLNIRFERSTEGQRIYADGEDLTEKIRTQEATRLSSPVSAVRGVRKRLVELQRKMGEQGGIVMEGRDIGTVVFPNAEVKVYLTASAEERARRRTEELMSKGIQADAAQIAADIAERDLRDSSRTHAPLRQAPDAVLIETDGMSAEQVADAIVALHNEKVAS